MQHCWEQDQLLHRIAHQIRQSLQLKEILQTAAREVRSLLKTDRVKIYRFFPDGHGQVIAESVSERLPSLLGLHFPADDIPPEARQMFVRVRQRSIVDLAQQQIGLSAGDVSETDLRYRPVDPCHVEYLRAMGVQSSVVVPILQEKELWGLLVSHHAEPRRIAEAELQLLQLVVNQLEIAITQATLVEQIRQQGEREKIANRIVTLLHAVPTIQFQAALEAVVDALGGTGGRLYLLSNLLPIQAKCDLAPHAANPDLYMTGTQPELPERLLEHHYLWQQYLEQNRSATLAIPDLYKEPAFRTLTSAFQSTQIRGVLIVSLRYNHQCCGCITIFRNQIATETLWAGQHDADQRQTMPRQSFVAWRELKSGQSQPWTEADLKLAEAICQHFAMAAQQHSLYQQVQEFNSSLEQQVQERTMTLQQSIERQKTLASVVAKIRASLDLSFVFEATVQEVRQLLKADRVGIFYFKPNSNWEFGEFIAEAALPAYSSLLNITVQDHCFGQDYAPAYHQGRIQAVADVENAGLTDCHVQALAKFQIKANLVVPLLQGHQLWGLLCIHQCEQPRHWTNAEIEFVSQIANQLGVGIQQAELLVQTQQQAEQLTNALHSLKNTQSQLIQTEKMSSLGQLVAGVAHEINNPVNFIYGNLDHAKRYADSLLQLVSLYQQHTQPNPVIAAALESADFEFLTTDLPKILTSMKVGADRIRQIVQSLRNFSRLDEAEYKPVDLHEGIDSTLLILQHRLKSNSATPEIEIIKEYNELPLVECYAGQLNQVFMNILSNAIDAVEKRNQQMLIDAVELHPGQIKISTQQMEEDGQTYAVISIVDNGCGIPTAIQSRIFDPFFTTKPIGHGTGLGLAISYQVITEKHNGHLKCISQPDQGAEFRIELPICHSH